MKNFLFWFPKALILILLVVSYSLFERNSSLSDSLERKDKRITELNLKILSLEEDVKFERSRFNVLDTVVSNTTDSITELKEESASTKREIEILDQRKKKNGLEIKKSPSDALDPELVSLLNATCERVRGSPCPNP